MLMNTWGFSLENITMLVDDGEEVTEEMMPTKANIEVRRRISHQKRLESASLGQLISCNPRSQG
jgi:hypothetical protein